MRRLDRNSIAGFVVMSGVVICGLHGVEFGDKPLFVYAIIGYVAGVSAMAIWSRLAARLSPERQALLSRPTALRALSDNLPALDYFHVNHHGAIGLDVSNRRIAVLNSTMHPISVFGFDRVFDCSIIMKNGTIALLFDMEDLSTPTVLVPMSEGGAEDWMRIFRRLGSGSLDPQEAPCHYP
jgi:hypothetical protein